MKNKITISLLSLLTLSLGVFAQTAVCDGTLPFEEKDGLLTIEMESGVLPSGSDWETGSEPDPNLPGATINYIFWNGTESFNALSGVPITYNIKINNPGTYRLAWRGRIGKGDSGGEHNDAWLRIVADDFYATNQNSSTATPQLEPKPDCTSNQNRDCPEGSSVGGFFKAFMNRHPINSSPDRKWGFVTNTNDGNSFRFIWATFSTAGNYSVIVDARSNSFFMDKMVLRRSDVSDTVAFDLSNPESSCYDASLSINSENNFQDVKVYPNPTKGIINIANLPINSKLVISNILGAKVHEMTITSKNQMIDISNLINGVYFITSGDNKASFVRKIIKL
mgnify:CR=1 FL=1